MFSNKDEGEAVFSVFDLLSLLPSQPFNYLLSWKGYKFSQMTFLGHTRMSLPSVGVGVVQCIILLRIFF